MTVAELISALQQLQPDAVVCATASDCCGCGFYKIAQVEAMPNGEVHLDASKFAAIDRTRRE
jgi:hypothetical protein